MFFLCCVSSVVIAAPIIDFAQPFFEFGTILQGDKVHHAFTFRNNGDAPLNINKIRSSCGCTAVTSTASVIQPQGKGQINATFDSTNFSGKIHKTISVDTNDPRSPSTTLTLSGKVKDIITVNPKQLSLGKLRINESRKSVIAIENNGPKVLTITSVKSPQSQIIATIDKKQLKHNESASISVTVTPHSGDRLMSGYLIITTNNPTKRDVIIPIFGSVEP